jgi:transposase-like protein
MPKSANFNEDRIAKAFVAMMREKKANISKIAREFNVSY